jgi:hypothetical protein
VRAQGQGFGYIRNDTCCIEKTNQVEASEPTVHVHVVSKDCKSASLTYPMWSGLQQISQRVNDNLGTADGLLADGLSKNCLRLRECSSSIRHGSLWEREHNLWIAAMHSLESTESS